MSHADDVFIKNFLAILGALVLFTILAFILARSVGFGAMEQMQGNPQAVAERIQPVGAVRTGKPGDEPVPLETQAAAVAPAGVPAAAEQTGEQIYNTTCMACHTTGVAGAPKLDEKDVWAARVAQGLDLLVQNAVNGKNAMPAKGGNPSLSDDDIKRAVEYMLTQAGVSAP
nr:cytochrome c5 family protein [Gammaproteobacteria bacterium]